MCLIYIAPLGLLILLAAVVGSFSLKKHWSDYFTGYENALDFNGRRIYFEDVESTQKRRRRYGTDNEGNALYDEYIEVYFRTGRRTTLVWQQKALADAFSRRGLMRQDVRDIRSDCG